MDILNYIKDQKEKGYEAETILKGLEAKLEIEQDTSEKKDLIDGLIEWARDYRNKVVSGDIDAKGVKISDAIMIYNAVEDDLIHHLKSLININ